MQNKYREIDTKLLTIFPLSNNISLDNWPWNICKELSNNSVHSNCRTMDLVIRYLDSSGYDTNIRFNFLFLRHRMYSLLTLV